MSEEENNDQKTDPGKGSDKQAENLEIPSFENIEESEPKMLRTEDENFELILDIPVQISVEIGRTYMNIRNILQLNQGAVVELDRTAGEPLDIMVNGTLIAHGEVVVINDKFGVRLTDVISASERIKKLK